MNYFIKGVDKVSYSAVKIDKNVQKKIILHEVSKIMFKLTKSYKSEFFLDQYRNYGILVMYPISNLQKLKKIWNFFDLSICMYNTH